MGRSLTVFASRHARIVRSRPQWNRDRGARGVFPLRDHLKTRHNGEVSHVRSVLGPLRLASLHLTGSRGHTARKLGLALCILALSSGQLGCQKDRAAAAPDAGGRPMDGMEKRAAGRAASDSAREAMAKRDLRELRMIRTYVLKRADEPLLPQEDVLLIDLGIQCLELGPAGSEAARGLLSRVKESKLARATRGACRIP
jgi:hypothetical protein